MKDFSSICSLLLLTLTLRPALLVKVLGEAETYLYIVYYEDNNCNGTAVSMVGHVIDDQYVWETLDSGTGICALESFCLSNPNATKCQSYEDLNGLALGGFSLDNFGYLFQCDTSNVDAECSFLDKCYKSSFYPSCHFDTFLPPELLENPHAVQNVAPANLDDQSYQIFYSDSECLQMEGLKAAITGENVWAITNETLTCKQSMACLYHPEGAMCQGFGGSSDYINITSAVLDNEAYNCTSANSSSDDVNNNTTTFGIQARNGSKSDCQIVEDVCRPSPINPNCYYRWTSAYNLFRNPEKFIRGNVTDNETPAENNKTNAGKETSSAASCSSLIILLVVSFLTLSIQGNIGCIW